VLTQLAPQATPVAQLLLQTPAEQTVPAVHATPQAPQFEPFDARSAQPVAQGMSPGKH